MARQGSNLEFSLPLVRLEFDEMPRQKETPLVERVTLKS
jgi:hypothetical protein